MGGGPKRDNKTGDVTNKKPAPTKTKQSPKPRKDHRTYQDREEYYRARQSKRRSEHISLGLCVKCSAPAISGQTRCGSCAEKHHRASRRKLEAQQRAVAQEQSNG